MNFLSMDYFLMTAEKRSFTKAADALHITQQTLSTHIANLEQELGVDLFEKQGRNVVLTRQGKLYLDYVQKALKSLEEGRSALQRMQSELNLRIDIGFVSSLQARMIRTAISPRLAISILENTAQPLPGTTAKESRP